jgi:hypothetical protein
VEPVLDFQHELVPISTLAYNFNIINSTIRIFLSEDKHANELRALLEPFNQHAFRAAGNLGSGIMRGRWFYVHDDTELKDSNIPDIITDEKAQILLDPEFQRNAREFAMGAAALLESASQLLVREVLPRLPGIEKSLKEYVDEYNYRHYTMQERDQSWIPSVLQDIMWGTNDPTTWNISEVRELPDDFDTGAKNLKKLPELLDRMRAHFKQLSELELDQVGSLGHSTIHDLHRLYRDRLQCQALLGIMWDRWDATTHAFPVPFPKREEYH